MRLFLLFLAFSLFGISPVSADDILNSKANQPKTVSKQPHRGNPPNTHPTSENLDPYLGFRPETDPTKVELKPTPVDGKDVAGEQDHLIRGQRIDVNRINSPSGSDRPLIKLR